MFKFEKSSVLHSAEFTQDGLIVNFLSGSSYLYPTVTEEAFNELTKAESAGKYFNQKIKGLESRLVL